MSALDVIVAPATPLAVSALSVIRVSGDDALVVLRPCLLKDFEPKARMVYTKWLVEPQSKVFLDQVCLCYFKGPDSFTGEDLIEITCHGNPLIVGRIIQALYASGAREAHAGEFAKRAFMQGKLQFHQAEAIGDLLEADATKSIEKSLYQLKGAPLCVIQEMRSEMMGFLERLEASVDFPDEIEPLDRVKFNSMCLAQISTLASFLDKKEVTRFIESGLHVVLLGDVNAGKSSLLNTLLDENRAIVSDVAGTTRDFISGRFELNGFKVCLYDTAGYRETQDQIEALGIEKLKSLIAKADVVCLVLDSTKPPHIDPDLLEMIKPVRHRMCLLNKSDLNQLSLPKSLSGHFESSFSISAKTKEGLDAVFSYLKESVLPIGQSQNQDFSCNMRQLGVLEQVLAILKGIVNQEAHQLEDDMLALELKAAVMRLSEFSGESITEEVLDGVFSRFCIGK